MTWKVLPISEIMTVRWKFPTMSRACGFVSEICGFFTYKWDPNKKEKAKCWSRHLLKVLNQIIISFTDWIYCPETLMFPTFCRYNGPQTVSAVETGSCSPEASEELQAIQCQEILPNSTVSCNHVADRLKGNDSAQWIQITESNQGRHQRPGIINVQWHDLLFMYIIILRGWCNFTTEDKIVILIALVQNQCQYS